MSPDPPYQEPTLPAGATRPPSRGPDPSSSARPASSPSSSVHGRFLPGTMLSERYRIVALLGRGGMGEVYRADDLKLGQTVALKFLPPEVEGDAERLAELLAEVRHARQISHPNICRVYDVGEVGGAHFISMEFVDGEDLASLLRRIGHLPADKATQVARQICAGIAAAHDQGILHRDLKPANIMLDGRGRARITDFGLALATTEAAGERGRFVGTPAYMAPEQLLSGAASPRSDLYALGLILYELFTGKRVFANADVARLVAHHTSGSESLPSGLSSELDPAVERVVRRCLERDPRDRPASALQVAAALPGGDPLAAALAAGETPSPELVASAATVGALPLRAALACAVAALALLAVVLGLRGRAYGALETPIAALSLRADEVLRASGVAKPPRQTAEGFVLGPRLDGAPTPRAKGAPELQSIFYWRRWSPYPLAPVSVHRVATTMDDPPYGEIGGALVVLDASGRLVALDAVPPAKAPRDATAPAAGAADSATAAPATPGLAPFGPLLAAAGLDTTRLVPVAPTRVPGVYADRVAAWRVAGAPATARIAEAGALGGRVVHFALADTAHSTADLIRMPVAPEHKDSPLDWIGALFFSFGTTAATVLLARRNLAVGRGDRRGATRLAAFVFAVNLLESVFTHPLGQRGVPDLLSDLADGKAMAHSLLHAVTMWFAYVAIEPYVRRIWPDMLVGWARLTSGRVRDPLVGRDVLVGGLAGLVGVTLVLLARMGAVALGRLAPQVLPEDFGLAALASLGGMAYETAWSASVSVLDPLWLLVWILLAHFVIRQRTASAVAVWILYVVVTVFSGTERPGQLDAFLTQFISTGMILLVLLRFGLLAGIASGFVTLVLSMVPATLDLSAWFVDRTAIGVGVVVVVLGWGFRTAIAGQRMFHDPLEEKPPASA